MRRFTTILALLAIVLLAAFPALAQMSGTYTIDNTLPTGGTNFISFTDAVTALNTAGVGGSGVIFNVTAGQTFTEIVPAITATGVSGTTIVFQKSGSGANPIVARTDAGINATSTLGGLGDAVLQINGTDYITFDGIDVTANNSGIEYGYLTHKPSATDGCQNVTIKNANITMTKGTSGYVIGIYVGNGTTSVSSATGVTVTAASGENMNITIIGNTIQNVHAGVVVRGSSATGFYDNTVVVGQSGAGNTIQNYGGGNASTTYAVYFIYVTNPSVAYNTINNAGGGGSAHGSSLYGIFYSTVLGDVVGSNNNFTLANNSASSATQYIYNANTATSENYNNNTFAMGTMSSTGTVYLIYASNGTNVKTISGNQTSGIMSRSGASGSVYCYYNFGSPTGGTETFIGNSFTNFALVGSSSLYGIYTNTAAAQNRVCSNNTIANWTGGTGSTYCYYLLSTTTNQVNGNTVHDITAGGTVYGLYFSGTNPTAYNNTVYNLTTSGTTMYGLYNGGSGAASCYKNRVYGLTVNNAAPSFYGYYISGGTTSYNYNNFVSDLKAPTASSATAIYGMYVSAGTTVGLYYNTIYLNGASTGTNFGTAGIYASTTPTVDLRNNAVVNTCTPAGTGLTVAYRRSSTTLTTYAATSNNNDFFASTTYYDGTTAYPTMAAYKTLVSPRDGASFAENPPFVNVATAPYDLHMQTTVATQTESGGTPVSTPAITDDFDGDARNATTPDVGADEFGGIGLDLTPPIISYTPLLNTDATGARTLVVTVTDPGSGVPTVAPGWPYLYWKKTGDLAYTGVAPSGVAGSQYTYSFGGTAVTGDVVSYYMVAQDGAGTPNITAYPLAGAGGFTANPPAAATPPTTPSSYSISMAPLSGIYTISASLFNRVSGHNITFEKVVTRVMKQVPEMIAAPSSQAKAVSTGKGPLAASPSSTSPEAGYLLTGRMVMREVEQVSWVPMENGREYTGPLYIKRSLNPNLPAEVYDGAYATITAAVADLNLRGVGGATTFKLTSASYTTETLPFVINIQNVNLPTAINAITFKPDAGVTALISGSGTSTQVFKILSSYVTIDGSNAGTTTRDLTIQNLATTGPTVIAIGSTGTTPIHHVTVKNCVLVNGANTSSAVIVSDGTAPGSDGYFNNITIQNNAIEFAYIGAYCRAAVATGNGNGLLLTGNDLNTSGTFAISSVGLYVQGVDGATVTNNHVANFNTTTSYYRYGIWFATGTVNSTISNNDVGNLNTSTSYYPFGITLTPGAANANDLVVGNTVHDMTSTSTGDAVTGIYAGGASGGIKIQKNLVYHLYNTSSGGYGAWGIALSSSLTASNIEVSNNMIYDINAYGYASLLYENGIGLFVNSGGGYNVYFNSINLYVNQTAGVSACVLVTSSITTASSLDIRNNIFVNSETALSNYCVYSGAANTAYADINYNDYYAASPTNGFIGYLGSAISTLPAWQTATGKDANSISGDPKFLGATNLHIDPNFATVSNNGFYLASVPTDFDNETRLNPPDIGADEYTYIPPSVADPTGVAASGGALHVNVSFTPNGNGNNVVIVYNLNGVFTVPSGPPPAPGNAFAGGTLIYNGTTSPFSHTGLTLGTAYYYKLFSYDGAAYSPGVTANATTAMVNPTAVTAVSGGTHQIDLGWTKNPNNDNIMVVFNTTNTFGVPVNGTAYAVNDPITGGGTVAYNNSGTSFNHTGLNAGTTYYYKVFSTEVATNYYSTGVAANATTDCEAITTFPWTEGFEGLSVVGSKILPACWSYANVVGTTGPTSSATSGTYYGPNTGTHFLYTSYANTTWMFTPAMTLTAGISYDFSFYMMNKVPLTPPDFLMDVAYGASQTPAGMTNVLATGIVCNNSTYLQFKYTFTPSASGTYYFGVLSTSATSAPWYLSFDDFRFEPTPSCPMPTGLTATGVTLNSVNIGWASATTVDVEHGPVGHTPGTGTITSGVTANPYTLGGLTPSTGYDVYVRQVCGPGNTSAWAGPVTFTTLCDVVSAFPYTESFSASLGCWSRSEGATGASYHWAPTTSDATYGAGAPQSGTHFVYLYVYLASTTYNPYYLTTPTFVLGATGKEVKYYYWLGTGGYQTSPAPLTLQITTNGGTSWTDLYAHTSANSVFGTTSTSPWTQNTVSLVAYIGQTVQLRFAANSNYGSGYCDQGIDEFTIDDLPANPPPTALTATGITENSANIGWTPGLSETAWEYVYGVSPVPPPSGPGTATTVNPTPLTGLTPSTTYEFYVRGNFGGGNYSTWAGPATFNTANPPLSLPYTQSFDGATMPPSWAEVTDVPDVWTVSTTSNAGGTPNEMYATWVSGVGVTRLVLGPISTTGATGLRLAFKHYYDDFAAGVTYKIQSSADGVAWTDESWTNASGNGNAGPVTVNTTIANNLGGLTYIAWVLDGDHYNYDAWYIDDVAVTLPLANDVGTNSIDVATNLMPGTIAPQATVKNFGSLSNTFSVQMTITGGYTSTRTVTALAPGATQVVTFDNWVAALGQYTVNVCTQLAGDGDPSNDCLTKDVGVYAGSYSVGAVYPTTTYLGSGVGYTSGGNNYLFSLGGNTTSALGTECYKYNVNTDVWTPIASLPSGRRVFASAIVGDFIYVIGGSDMSSVYQSTVYKYDIVGDTWSTVASLPLPIAWGKAVGHGNDIYFAGGHDGTNVLSTVYVYDVVADTWTAATSLPGGIFGGGFSVTGNTLVYIGGADALVISDVVYVGAIDTGNPLLITWTTAASKYPGLGKETHQRSSTSFFESVAPRKGDEKTKKGGGRSHQVDAYPPGVMYRFDGAPWGTDGVIVATGSPTADWVPASPSPCYVYKPATDTWIKAGDVPIPVLGASLGSVTTATARKLIIASGLGLTDATQIWTEVTAPSTTTRSIPIQLNWNMVSVPVLNPTPDDSVQHLFTNSINRYAFIYAGGYQQRFTMTMAPGYWIKSNAAYTQDVTGIPRDTLTIPTTNAWNMIGSITTAVDTSVAHVTPSVPGLRISNFFKYASGYQIVTTIQPGLGYWIKSNGPGWFFMHATGPVAKVSGGASGRSIEDLHSLTITDADGGMQTLYFGADGKKEIPVNMFVMPPLPPMGSFDARFETVEGGTMAQTHPEEVSDVIDLPIAIQSSAYPLTVSWKINGTSGSYELSDGSGVLHPVRGEGSLKIASSAVNHITLKVTSGSDLPKEFSLSQNYPNPFNPTTTIKYGLPVDSRVTVEIYNVLGQRVRTLMNEDSPAGRYVVEWNGTGNERQQLASGVYFLHLSAKGVNGKAFNEVRKLMMVK